MNNNIRPISHRIDCQRSLGRGFSLLEMVAASALMASILVPALAVMRDAMAKGRDLGRRNLLANYAASILEEQAAVGAAGWVNETVTGSYTADGYPDIRYSVVKSDDPADGGITSQLMHVQVTVFDDADQDTVADADELQVLFRTKIAKLESYENEPQ